MVRCKHDWGERFRFLPRQTHWCQKCGTWRITFDKDSQTPGYKYRYFRPQWMKKVGWLPNAETHWLTRKN